MDGETLRVKGTKEHLGMKLSASGKRPTRSTQRVENRGSETVTLVKAFLLSFLLAPSQLDLVFIAVVSAKYTYGLPFIEMTEEIRKVDTSWSDMVIRELLRSK